MKTETFINGKWTFIDEIDVHKKHEQIFIDDTFILTPKHQVEELTAIGLAKFYSEGTHDN